MSSNASRTFDAYYTYKSSLVYHHQTNDNYGMIKTPNIVNTIPSSELETIYLTLKSSDDQKMAINLQKQKGAFASGRKRGQNIATDLTGHDLHDLIVDNSVQFNFTVDLSKSGQEILIRFRPVRSDCSGEHHLESGLSDPLVLTINAKSSDYFYECLNIIYTHEKSIEADLTDWNHSSPFSQMVLFCGGFDLANPGKSSVMIRPATYKCGMNSLLIVMRTQGEAANYSFTLTPRNITLIEADQIMPAENSISEAQCLISPPEGNNGAPIYLAVGLIAVLICAVMFYIMATKKAHSKLGSVSSFETASFDTSSSTA